MFNAPVQEWGVIRLPSGLPTGADFSPSFSAESTLSVTAGVAQTVVLGARHIFGTAADDCSGTFRVQVFTGTLP